MKNLKNLAGAIAVVGLLGAGVTWAMNRSPEPNRADCPGLINCPLTGDAVCADRCPLMGR